LIGLFSGTVARSDGDRFLARIEAPASFHIAAGSLESVLLAFSRQTQIQVIASPQVVDLAVPGVEGRLSAREALTTILKTTGLVYTIVGDTITIHAGAGGMPGSSESARRLPL